MHQNFAFVLKLFTNDGFLRNAKLSKEGLNSTAAATRMQL